MVSMLNSEPGFPSLFRAKTPLRHVDRPMDTGIPTAVPTVSTTRNHRRKKKSSAISTTKARAPFRISSATVYVLFVCCCLLADARPQGAIAESMVPRARPKGRALVRVRGAIRLAKEGTTQPCCTRPAEYPQAGFTTGSFPQISISRSITATRLWAIGTRKNEHAKARPFSASDSPRRASRYDLLAGGASVACIRTRSQPRSRNPTPCPTIRSAALFMVADRSAPSRDASISQQAAVLAKAFPLDRALRPAAMRASRSERPRKVDLSAFIILVRMPSCLFCSHRGSDHNWRVPPCSARPYCNCAWEHPQRLRGRCQYAGCRCLKYVPDTDRPQPVNRYIGRLQRLRKCAYCRKLKRSKFIGRNAYGRLVCDDCH
jgi:hypothetical protein